MKLPRFSSTATLRELMAWCEFARENLQEALQPDETEAVRRMKMHFLRDHQAHLAQLRDYVRGEHPRRTRKPGFGQDLQIALRSHDAEVVASACFLLERSLLAAYARAADSLILDAGIRRVIRRQRMELKCSLEHYLRRPSLRRERPAARAAEVEAVPAMSALMPAAS